MPQVENEGALSHEVLCEQKCSGDQEWHGRGGICPPLSEPSDAAVGRHLRKRPTVHSRKQEEVSSNKERPADTTVTAVVGGLVPDHTQAHPWGPLQVMVKSATRWLWRPTLNLLM